MRRKLGSIRGDYTSVQSFDPEGERGNLVVERQEMHERIVEA